MEAFSNRIDLLDDIWRQVFVSLSLEDRNSIRLTCNRFYRLCDDARILKKEVIVFYANVNIDSAIQVLSKTRKIIRNVKLKNVVINDSVLLFFKSHNSNLWFVHFENCEFARGAFKSIIENCNSIYSITLQIDWLIYGACNPVNIILHDLATLENNSFICNNVTDLKIRIPINNTLCKDRLLSFFNIFPNVRRLDLEMDLNDSELLPNDSVFSDAAPYSDVSLSHVCNRILGISDQLEKLSLQLDPSPKNLSYLFTKLFDKISSTALETLRELSFNWIRFRPDPSILNAILCLKHLTHFRLTFEFTTSHETAYTFLQLLLNNTLLRCLIISTYALLIDRELFQALVKSKLKKLIIRMLGRSDHFAYNFEPSCLENVLMPNYHLQHLLLDGVECNKKLLFTSYFRSVKHLEFPETNDCVLHSIFKDQTQIHSLRLNNKSFVCSAYDLNYDFKELSSLQQWLEREKKTIKHKLEYLTYIHINEDKYSLTCFMLSQFLFPQLKTLSINTECAEGFDEEQFWKLFQNFPQLQYLNLNLPVATSVEQWPSFLNSLTKLRHLYVQDPIGGKYRSSDYHQLFKIVPSLRTVVHQQTRCLFDNSAFYLYDIITKNVRSFSKKDNMSDLLEFNVMLDLHSHHYCKEYYTYK